MHNCLGVQEIQSLILGYLSPSTLAHVAASCKAFSDTSLAILWCEQNTLAPLIKVMPSDLWEITEEEVENEDGEETTVTVETLIFSRLPRPTDWSRFELYARRIRGLGKEEYITDHCPEIYVHESVLQALGLRSSKGMIILPNLRRLSIHLEHPHVTESIPFFAHFLITVTELNISTDRVVDNLLEFLSAIPIMCPKLEQFEFGFPVEASFELAHYIRTSLCQLQSLRVVNFSYLEVSFDLIRHLASLPTLVFCGSFILPEEGIDNAEFRDVLDSIPGNFQSLKELEFESPDWKIAQQFACAFHSPLITLTAEGDSDGTDNSAPVVAFITSILHNSHFQSLTTLTVHDSLVTKSSSVEGSLSVLPAFRGLFAMTALQHVWLGFGCVSQLDDQWVADATEAWPDLRFLALTQGSGLPKITLAGLVPLAKGCPHLVHIDIPVDAKPFKADIVSQGIQNMILTDLSFSTSPIADPYKVFRCLVLMFPKLDKLFVHGVDEQSEMDWHKVVRLLDITALSED